MEQSKAMEYGSRKASSDVLKPRNIHIYTYIYIYIYIYIYVYIYHNIVRRLCRVSNHSVTHYESHRFRSRLLSLRMFEVVFSTKVRFFSWTVQPYTVHIRHEVIAVVLLETSLTSAFLFRPLKEHWKVYGLHSNEEVETAVRERSRA